MLTILQKTPSQMLNRDLDLPWNIKFVLTGLHRNIDICQTDLVFTQNLKFSPYSEVIHGSATKVNKGYRRMINYSI